MKKIKGVIFDLDGTLANTLPLCIQAFKNSIEPLAGRTLSDEEIIATFGPSEEGTIMELVPDHFDKGIASYLHFYESLHHTCQEPFSGIPEILAALKREHIKIALVTGKGKHSTAISLRQFGMEGLFEIIETGSITGPRKADGIRDVLNRWNDFETQEVLYVGDAPSDIVACKQVGIPVVAAAWAATAEPEKLIVLAPDRIFYNIDEFASWLQSSIER